MIPEPLIDPITGKIISQNLIDANTGKPKNDLKTKSLILRGGLLFLGLMYCLWMYITNEYIPLPSKSGHAAQVNGRYCLLIIAAAFSAILALLFQYTTSKRSVFVWSELRPIHIILNCLAFGLLLSGFGLSQFKEHELWSEVNTKNWALMDTSEAMRVYVYSDDVKAIMSGSADPVLRIFMDYTSPQPDDTQANRLWRSTFITYQIHCDKGSVQEIAQTDFENHFDGINTPSGYSENASHEWLTKHNQSPQMTVDVKNTYANFCKQHFKKVVAP